VATLEIVFADDTVFITIHTGNDPINNPLIFSIAHLTIAIRIKKLKGANNSPIMPFDPKRLIFFKRELAVIVGVVFCQISFLFSLDFSLCHFAIIIGIGFIQPFTHHHIAMEHPFAFGLVVMHLIPLISTSRRRH
tara:strand:+ start:1351 stop:1755 length:405 start_codon:yes stop_codon:yes gene_type:complete